MPSQWIIIYPRGDRGKVSTAEICDGLEYEIGDYDRASRRSFGDEIEAAKYARKLAREWGLDCTCASMPAYLDEYDDD